MSALLKLFLFCNIFYVLLSAPPPTPVFDSYGALEIFQDEGAAVLTPAGKDYLPGVTPDQCAQVCHWMLRQCDCCNAFSYHPFTGSKFDGNCFLKKRREDALEDRTQHNVGFQSYKFWGTASAVPGGDYTGVLPDVAFGASVGAPIGASYSFGFSNLGSKRQANFQGEDIKTSQGYYYLTGATPRICAEECGRTQDCDGFSYNPEQDSGKCYLKKNSASGKYATSVNQEGWTFFWKETGNQWFQNCYCTCASRFVCVTCRDDGTCDAF
eukprot:TRINITY_DN1015_c1_g6_i2.p1 TRINITY_DN1015_c1_g6~~TRINITY_DN1015_c1_g6_i2.p1  ORF type:complete len:281 (+),score=39.07 TRINITY_DN1015_c1_g6_i2:41-844(+)